MKTILLTGGCGFVGSSLAVSFKEKYPQSEILCFDNLRRRGSELNIARLQAHGIHFIHGDIRNTDDLEAIGDASLVIDCSAEPSVLAGHGTSPRYVIDTNLTGTMNLLEWVRKHNADLVFLSTSRVYPIPALSALRLTESETRFDLSDEQNIAGCSSQGISERFPMEGHRSLYGATKFASELLIHEYIHAYGLRAIINRCGVLAGPGQFGKVDQGFIVLWVARHVWKKPLAYIGFGGQGKQVRDILHVRDLFSLLEMQIASIERHSGQIYNVGGGLDTSISLCELTRLCEEVTGNHIEIASDPATRDNDIPLYISDTSKIETQTGWKPQTSISTLVEEVYQWIHENETSLKGILL